MCSIFGYVSNNGIKLKDAIANAKRLEMRGYDSCGIFYEKDGNYILNKTIGGYDNLSKGIDLNTISRIGILHSRWATTGKVSEINAHPHQSRNLRITLVHNGIIENYQELKTQYEIKTKGETDTEVLANLIACKIGNVSLGNIQETLVKEVKGTYALIIHDSKSNGLYVTRKEMPLLLGTNGKEVFISSDVVAFPKSVDRYYSLENYEIFYISRDYLDDFINSIKWKSLYNKFDELKDGHDTLTEIEEEINIPKFDMNSLNSLKKVVSVSKRVFLIGCGTSYHACLYGKRQIETQYKGTIPVFAKQASEALYDYESHFSYGKDDLAIFISQSGETADTLSCLRRMKREGVFCVSLLNKEQCSMERESDISIQIGVGQEFAVASTKAYLGQCTFFNRLCEQEMYSSLDIDEVLYGGDYHLKEYKKLAEEVLLPSENIYFIGKLADYIQCREGALKMKEITYTPSEAYPAGELKHGPLAMITDKSTVIAVCTYDGEVAPKILNAIKEVQSRGAKVILIMKNISSCLTELKDVNIIKIPNCKHADLLSIVPMQCLSYYLAKAKGNDDMHPRNLAKSVTVE